MKFSKIVAAIFLVVGTGVAFADVNEKQIKKEATEGSASENKHACKAAEVFFKFDSAMLAAADDSVLQPLVDEMNKYEGTRIVLDGFADPRGTNGYNVILSGKRAEAVRERLIALGAPGDRIVLGLHGETGPQRDSYPADRRVTAWITRNTTDQIVRYQLENGAQALAFGDQMQNLSSLKQGQVATRDRAKPAAVDVDVVEEGEIIDVDTNL
jgi:outer membrane protein OmpA-like peptidoglycan-associated protein